MMTISLVIPAYNEEEYIGACLDSALENSHGKFKEIIVVDNASTDHTGDIARKRPGVVVIREDRKGTGHARQTGLEHATGEFVAYMDADTRVPEQWFGMVEAIFSKDPGIVLLSGPYRYYDSSWYKRWTQYALWWISAPLVYRLVGYMALGGNIVVKRGALLRAGGISRDITFYGDDTDLARKMHTVGKVVWRMDFFVYASMRRFNNGGIFKTNLIYALNYIWPVVFNRPYTLGR